jgi:hypothetical protein
MPDKTLLIDQANEELSLLLDKYEWFYTSIVEGTHICVYVSHMNNDVISTVPKVLYGYHITLGFVSNLLCEDKYNSPLTIEDLKNNVVSGQ